MDHSTLKPVSLYPWRFFRAGGFDQVQLDTGEDLLHLPELDQKLWVALSCPVNGIEFDRRTLELIDIDRDGHIRAPELLEAISWIAPRLNSPELLHQAKDGVPLSAINESVPEGASLMASVRTVLQNLGKGDAAEITIDDACDTERIFSQTRFNGDGVITVDSTENLQLKGWIEQIIDVYGGVIDRSGSPGVSTEMLERFSAETESWLSWQNSASDDQYKGLPANGREAALQIWDEVNAKIEDYFIRCRMADYDTRAEYAMNASDETLLQLAPGNLAESLDEIARLPLSAVSKDQSLNLAIGVNPAWIEKINLFMKLIVEPLAGDKTTLTSDDWAFLKSRYSLYLDWWSKRVVVPVSAIGYERLKEWTDSTAAADIGELLAKDLALKPEFESIIDVERLARYCRDLYPLANNFVSFRDFYFGKGEAVFLAGTLYIDGRSCRLTVPVSDIAKHVTLASLSRVYLVYCECVRDGGNERRTIAAAITNGDSDQIVAGRNGVFYDRSGLDWDATIVRIIEHPISIRQAFWSPYKRIGKMVGEQIQKMANARSKAAEEKLATGIIQTGTAQKEGVKPPAQQQLFDVGKFAGIFAAIGLAVGAIGTAIASILTGFFKLSWWQMPLAFAGILLILSGPSVLIAWFKLHQRNLGPILDANGWAVNARAKLNIPFGKSLTAISRLPEGARISLSDPYAEKKKPWKLYVFMIALLLGLLAFWSQGYIKLPLNCSWTNSNMTK